MSFRFELAGSVLLAGALAVAVVALPAVAQDSSSSSSSSSAPSSAAEASATPAAASDAEIVAAGKRVWQDAACYNCHGTNGQGGHSADFPNGPSLRKSALDSATMLMIIECGLPGTRMPAWLKGAYTNMSCYGNELGPVPTGILVAGAYGEEQLKALVAYVHVNFMKQPVPTWSDQ